MSVIIKKTSKNLLKNTATSQTINGVTFTVNDDGSVTANGTATERANFTISTKAYTKITNGKYILSGCEGGSDSTYRLQWWMERQPAFMCTNGEVICDFAEEEYNYNVAIVIFGGTKVENVTFYPMIRHAKKSKKNLLDNTATSQTINGVTFTVNSDCSVTANGTASAGVTFTVAGARDDLRNRLQGKELILTGCPSGGSDSTYRLQCHGYKGDTAQARDRGNGVSFTFTNESSSFNVSIVIATGTVCDNLVFKPMIRLASIEDDTYEPYLDKTPIPYEQYSEYKWSKNLLDCRGLTEQTINGVTFKPYFEDGLLQYILVNGTAKDIAYYDLATNFDTTKYSGRYFSIYCDGLKHNAGTYTVRISTKSSRASLQDIVTDKTTIVDNGSDLLLAIRISAGCVISNVKFYPMLYTEDDNTYEPYIEPKALTSSASTAQVIKDGITTFLKTIKVLYGGVETVVWKAGAAVTYVVDSGVSYTEDVDGGASCLSPKTFTPAKSGWTFVGWREDTTASADVLTSKVMGDEPIKLYAVYSKTITLSYNGNGHTSGSTPNQSGTQYFNASGSYKHPSLTLAPNGYTKTDYTFTKWAIGSASGKQYEVGASITITGNTTFYAYWAISTKGVLYENGALTELGKHYVTSLVASKSHQPPAYQEAITYTNYIVIVLNKALNLKVSWKADVKVYPQQYDTFETKINGTRVYYFKENGGEWITTRTESGEITLQNISTVPASVGCSNNVSIVNNTLTLTIIKIEAV